MATGTNLMLTEHADMKKADALDRLNRNCRSVELDNRNTLFSNINHTEPVWWFHVPLWKIERFDEEHLHFLCYDRRSYKLHHLVVPVEYLKLHLNRPQKLQIIKPKQVVQLELSIKTTNLFADRISGCRFAQLQCCDVSCEHS
jgi:hypothetical protein